MTKAARESKACKPEARIDKLIEPYAQGWEASTIMLERGDNPYVHDSGAHLEWLKGYEAGEDDWQELCRTKGITYPPVI